MGKTHHPRRGSVAYSPRKRAKSHIPKFKAWPVLDISTPKIQGFAGYKAGMTHVIALDKNKTSLTAEREVFLPVTVVEVPPMRVVAVRFYVKGHNGLETLTEIWAPPSKLPKFMDRNNPVPKKEDKKKEKEKWDRVNTEEIADVRIIAATQPYLIKGVPKKKPDLIEFRIDGGDISARKEYAKNLLGKDIDFDSFAHEGAIVDVAAVTKGKGFQGPVRRFGIKLLSHKDSKGRRKVGAEGAWHPHWTPYTVPQAGQTGYHHRIEFNKQILRFGKDGKEVTPKGGFLHYGILTSKYVLVKGSIPGPVKRLVAFRDPIRFHGKEPPRYEITYISTESKQGV